MSCSKNMRGLYTALVTPYDKSGNVNYPILEDLVELNRKNGIHRFYVTGSSAEMTQLSFDERREILKTVAGTKPKYLIAHVGGENARVSVALAREAGICGADAISAVTPYYYKYTFAEIKDYYARLADAAGLPVVVYSIPTYSGVSFSVSELKELMSCDFVSALKFTSRDTFLIERAKSVSDKPVFNGCDEILTSGLIAGADGAIGAMYNVLADKAARVYEAHLCGDITQQMQFQSEINGIIEVTSALGGLKCVKALLSMLGYPVGELRAPFLPLSKEAIDRLRSEVLPKITLGGLKNDI